MNEKANERKKRKETHLRTKMPKSPDLKGNEVREQKGEQKREQRSVKKQGLTCRWN